MLRELRKIGGGAVSIGHSPLDDKAERLVGRRRIVHCDTVCGRDDRTQASAADTPHCILATYSARAPDEHQRQLSTPPPQQQNFNAS
jgi:hypothetical protein